MKRNIISVNRGARQTGEAVTHLQIKRGVGADTGDATLTRWEVAKRLRVNDRTVGRYMAAGMPHFRLTARTCRFNWAAVMAWLEANFQRGDAA